MDYKTAELLLEMVRACGVDWLLDPTRIQILHEEMERVRYLPGIVAEIGVFQGATSLMIHNFFRNQSMHVYDTFSGIPESEETCKFTKGYFSCPIENVQRVLGYNTVVYHVGVFPESFHEHEQNFVFVHSDTDTYTGTLATLNVMFPSLIKGGIIVLDDYTFEMTPGVKQAVDDWLRDNRDKCKIREYEMNLSVTKL
jgi:hypothetical protein